MARRGFSLINNWLLRQDDVVKEWEVQTDYRGLSYFEFRSPIGIPENTRNDRKVRIIVPKESAIFVYPRYSRNRGELFFASRDGEDQSEAYLFNVFKSDLRKNEEHSLGRITNLNWYDRDATSRVYTQMLERQKFPTMQGIGNPKRGNPPILDPRVREANELIRQGKI